MLVIFVRISAIFQSDTYAATAGKPLGSGSWSGQAIFVVLQSYYFFPKYEIIVQKNCEKTLLI
jgi:hypothetical protein